MKKEFDLLVFIGRFQPLHDEHLNIINTALKMAHNVLVLVGSAGSARTIRNPFTFDEREQMISMSVAETPVAYNSNLIIKPIYDKTYNDTAWVKQVQSVVYETALDVANGGPGAFRNHGINDIKVGLIGASKDNTSYYLKLFPQFASVNVKYVNNIHATELRNDYFSGKLLANLGAAEIPGAVASFLIKFAETETYQKLKAEADFVINYKKQWAAAPYPVKHATVDAVVEQSGHILLVRRRSAPGKGLWAIPGGHLNEYEKILDGVIRELREETKLKVPDPVLRGSIKNKETFDDPYRSTLGRVITQAYHFRLADDTKLPKVKGEDDAEKAKWFPIADIREDMMFDDHYFIIAYFLGL